MGQLVAEEEKAAQEKSLKCLDNLKELFKDSIIEVFLLDEEEKEKLDIVLRDIWFLGANSDIDIQKDGLVYCLNEEGEPCLFFVEDFETLINPATMTFNGNSRIGIVKGNETNELSLFACNPDWRFDKHRDGANGLEKTSEGIALADCMVDIVNAQLESEEVA